MKRFRIKCICTCVLTVIVLFAHPASISAATGRQMAESAIVALKMKAPLSITTRNLATLEWSWFEVNYADEAYPLTVDFVGSNFSSPRKIVYLLPGGGVNFRSSFFTPMDKNLAQFFRKNGYLVVGITPREDNVPSLGSYSCMKNWGMAKHLADIREIIDIVQKKLGMDYAILGHSFGAAYALDYASRYYYDSRLKKVIALDIYSFAPGNENSRISMIAYQELITEGTYADTSYSQMKSLMLMSMLLPDLDSGQPRGDTGPGDFTFEGMLYFSLIWSNLLDGTATPKTGLPGDWPLAQSYAAGWYSPATDPQDDEYGLSVSVMSTLMEAGFKVGSGLVPCALYRDFYAVNAGTGTYSIDWPRISVPVLWVNSELGYGSRQYGADHIATCETEIIPGYGHLDLLAGPNAQADVWSSLLH